MPPDTSTSEQQTIMLIATRPLGPPLSGRKIVLLTAVRSLASLGHRIVVAAFGAADGDDDRAALQAGAFAVHRLPSPSIPRMAAAALGAQRRWALNEQLWWHPAALDTLRELVVQHGVTLSLADGLRTTRYAQALGLPWFVDLDDLLSDRYARWADAGVHVGRVMGFRRPERRILQMVLDGLPASAVLRHEAGRLRRRELDVARAADGVSLVSPVEAARLADRSGRDVSHLPMAIDVAESRRWEGRVDLRRMAFTGSLTWWPNLAAVRWWAHELEPELRRRGLPGHRMHVFGDVPADLRKELDVPGVVLEGRLDQADLQHALASYPVLLVPQTEAMGLTTKIIEAAMIGLVVLTTRAGTEGLDVGNREQVLHFDDVDELEQQLRWLTDSPPEELAALGSRAREWAASRFSASVVAERWRDALQGMGRQMWREVGRR